MGLYLCSVFLSPLSLSAAPLLPWLSLSLSLSQTQDFANLSAVKHDPEQFFQPLHLPRLAGVPGREIRLDKALGGRPLHGGNNIGKCRRHRHSRTRQGRISNPSSRRRPCSFIRAAVLHLHHSDKEKVAGRGEGRRPNEYGPLSRVFRVFQSDHLLPCGSGSELCCGGALL